MVCDTTAQRTCPLTPIEQPALPMLREMVSPQLVLEFAVIACVNCAIMHTQ
ncbi:hypothetical protein RE6C_00931 [Rhodopirellula europaea 6C]|uniref:Uncharacterized protein n=1 Tax=Rhodopirellula europaea 6C TaxID=1263867 RepID=M2B0A8_9BACT|nr:hypothetical protein RE6C_00931 [Rhodopirellula europaea 6C]